MDKKRSVSTLLIISVLESNEMYLNILYTILSNLFAGSFQISDSIQALSDVSPSYESSPDFQSLGDEAHRGYFDHSPELYPMVPEQKYRPPPNMCRG